MDERVLDWEEGLPGLDDLTPLSQSLIPPELLSAFNIIAETPRTVLDVNRASDSTLTSIHNYSNNHFKSFVEEDTYHAQNTINIDNEDNYNASINEDIGSSKSSKRPRLVWTPQLHKRFVDVVAHLGIKNAVPKTIMQWMNVEGLTRENVASHLQKYRLYLKRMHGLSDEGPSGSDHLFASMPVPKCLRELNGKEGSDGMMDLMSYPPTLPQMIHMPYVGMMTYGNGYQGSQYHNHVARNEN